MAVHWGLVLALPTGVASGAVVDGLATTTVWMASSGGLSLSLGSDGKPRSHARDQEEAPSQRAKRRQPDRDLRQLPGRGAVHLREHVRSETIRSEAIRSEPAPAVALSFADEAAPGLDAAASAAGLAAHVDGLAASALRLPLGVEGAGADPLAAGGVDSSDMQGVAAHAGSGAGGAEDHSGIGGHGPVLLSLGAPCANYFPGDAQADRGEVRLRVDVDAEGHTQTSAVLTERPRGQGFGAAARACARRLRFAPAVSAGGVPRPGRAQLKLRFAR